MKDHLVIWDAVSHTWSEIGLDQNDFVRYAEKMKRSYATWEEVELVIKKDVCASFAFESFLLFPCMLWMIMPDWGYNQEYLRRRMTKWYSRQYLFNWLNPFRIVGYPIALILSASIRSGLKRAYEQA